jgi:nucleoside 2-deoxyribosyltransferase
MWFDASMNDVFDLGISKAVTECGLPPPIRVDRKEHNNQITDEIIAGIRDAEFVIADFSGNRGGVYYEAGFARGLGRAVIHCCRESDFDDRHFDTKLINHIKWSNAADLHKKLVARIKATIIPTA